MVVATLVAYFAGWPVATIDSRFGGTPAGLPGLHFPAVSLEAMRDLMGPAFTIAALGAIESLLSAVVADGMTDTRHDPNQELLAQGIANVLCPIVGESPLRERSRARPRTLATAHAPPSPQLSTRWCCSWWCF